MALEHLSGADVRKLEYASSLLNSLALDSDRLEVLLDLQRFLAQRIRSRERMMRRTRKHEAKLRSALRRDRLNKAEAKRVKESLAKCSDHIERARRWIFLWKCFGDGAACVYQSPYNLKHLFYDLDYQVKQEAGFISGKDGFDREWEILEYGIRSGVPVVLSDVTNMIRIGDVCALAGPDPIPIEIKSSRSSGARAARQQRLLEEVTTFFQNDGVAQFKGLHNVTRLEVADGPDYRPLMNACIGQALRDGYAIVSPEAGLHYVAVTSVEHLDKIDALMRPTVLVRSLTADPGWLPCLPFTLSFEPGNLVSFIAGKVAVLVLTDMEYLKSLFLQYGSYATMVMDGQSAIQLCVDPNDLMKGVFRISELHFARVALEFRSLDWFAKENTIRSDEHTREMTAEEFKALPEGSYCFEAPTEWAAAKDFYADAQISNAITEKNN